MKNLLNTIYSSSTNMVIFYLILGIIALVFIVLIVITILKGKNEFAEEKKNKKFDVSDDSIGESEFTKQIKELPIQEKNENKVFNEILKEASLERDLLTRTEQKKDNNQELIEEDLEKTQINPILTNELLKEKLDKLKKERNNSDNLNNLDDIMKTVGLDDIPILKNESETLGK